MDVFDPLVNLLWGPWTPWCLFAGGILFTIWTRFTQYASMTHGIAVLRGDYDRPEDPGAINHFQALSAALSGTVGLGNIGGVALAISIGGPGALFWMWMVAFFGMALKNIEITLAMLYRNTDDPDNPHGGAMWVVDKVLGSKGGVWKPIAKTIGVFFCISLLNSVLTGSGMFQTWNVAVLTENYFGIPRVGTGVIIIVLVGLVIIGGIKRIGNVAGKMVPLMCLLYILSAFAVLAVHVTEIPGLLVLIVKSAFTGTEASGAFLGGTLGFAFLSGMKRALYSNEAGQGSAPIAHAAAKTDEPAREGIVGGLGPFIDTICICSITALVILATGTWNREAIGKFRGEIQLVKDGTASDNVWKVEAGTDVALLPVSRFDAWKAGADLFLLAKASGAENKDTGSNILRIHGTIVEGPSHNGVETPRPLLIEWKPVEINPAEWTGPVRELSLVDGGVFCNYGGAHLTAHAFDREFPGLGKWLVTIASWLFALSTLISWSYYGEQGTIYMFGERAVFPYKVIFLFCIYFGATGIDNAREIITVIDIGTGLMLWGNLPIVLVLGFLAVRSLNDYMRRLKAGELHPHARPKFTDVVEGRDVE